ncbi:hypothetical protein M446_6719 [Methylobacterium sp. 4-46]|uniref:hypothetical protein n=1 Tax=unclassified Methylobacterium TaxID=2615210 RepID=UPI000165CCD1|nr:MULTISPECIES: hypothetical protein [Methylobacterium]ACA20969.1 hypothetical protein M446_6719 [Methylobacterium sp. 4-46]WFT80124.1 hypothetical protein QA634_33935 [Methylobacterium nodulans]
MRRGHGTGLRIAAIWVAMMTATALVRAAVAGPAGISLEQLTRSAPIQAPVTAKKRSRTADHRKDEAAAARRTE